MIKQPRYMVVDISEDEEWLKSEASDIERTLNKEDTSNYRLVCVSDGMAFFEAIQQVWM